MGTCQSSQVAKKVAPNEKHLLDVTQRTIPGLLQTLPSSIGEDGEIIKRNPEVESETEHPIFKRIEDIQTEAGISFGRILDAGTGLGSLKWVAHLTSSRNNERFGVSDWTAITASETMIRLCTKEGDRLGLSTKDRLILGNWFGKGAGENNDDDDDDDDEAPEKILFPRGDAMYDTILVDYLIGAMDAFSPFRQDCIFDRLGKHLKPGGRIYLLGMEPIPETQNGVADLVCKAKRLRDACILLAGERCYREHPISWVERNMKKSGLDILHKSKFPLLHREEDIHDQVGTARWYLRHINDRNLASSLEDSLDELEAKIHSAVRGQPIRLGFDYLVVAEKSGE